MNGCQFDLDLERWHKGNARQAVPLEEQGWTDGPGRGGRDGWERQSGESEMGGRRSPQEGPGSPPPFPQQAKESAASWAGFCPPVQK